MQPRRTRLTIRMMSLLRRHFWHHRRFYVSACLGIFVWAMSGALTPPLRLAIAGDVFFGAYLILMTALAIGATPNQLRNWASVEDEGIFLIVIVSMAVIAFSLVSIFSSLNQSQRPPTVLLVLSIASAPLGWFMLHTLAAFHYAHLYYAGARRGEIRGLKFPGTEEPKTWDFLYYSFVIGMTAQVSDVQVLTTSMRKLALAHGIVSFYFNTVLIALVVNVAVVMAQSFG